MVPPRIGIARSPATVAVLYLLLVLVACGVTFHSLSLSMRVGDDVVMRQQQAAVDRGLNAFLHRLALEMQLAGLAGEVVGAGGQGAEGGGGCTIPALTRRGFKTCFVVDENGQAIRSDTAEPAGHTDAIEPAWRFARKASRAIADMAFRPPFHRNEYRHLAATSRGADVYHRHVVELTNWNGTPAFAVASTMLADARAKGHDGMRIVIAIAPFGDESLKMLGAEIGLSGMRWVDGNAAGAQAVFKVRNSAGAEIGIVGWRGSRLTAMIVEATKKKLLGAAILMVVLSVLVVLLAGNYLWQMREDRARIQHYVEHDQLTGLGNRFLFDRRINEELALLDRRGGKLSLLSLDLDRFKFVNDNFGHRAGDVTLIEVARRIGELCPANANLIRLGGDEIAVLLPGADHPAAFSIAERIIESIGRPIEVEDGVQASVGACAGLVVLPDDAGDAVEALLRADLALYQAKRTGGNLVKRFGIELMRETVGLSNQPAQSTRTDGGLGLRA